MKKRYMVVFALLGLLLLLVASPDCNAADPIKVGIIRALTGPAGDAGRSQREALTYVYDKVNKEGASEGERSCTRSVTPRTILTRRETWQPGLSRWKMCFFSPVAVPQRIPWRS